MTMATTARKRNIMTMVVLCVAIIGILIQQLQPSDAFSPPTRMHSSLKTTMKRRSTLTMFPTMTRSSVTQLRVLSRTTSSDDRSSTPLFASSEGTMVDATTNATAAIMEEGGTVEEELDKTQAMLKQVKDAGLAGVISYACWELAFWFVSIPVVIFGYYEVVGHWPDFANNEDVAKLSAEAFAFVNFARFAVPLRIGLALSTTPWIQENIVDKFIKKKKKEEGDDEKDDDVA